MKAIHQLNRKGAVVLSLFVLIAFGAKAHWGPGFGYHKKHHYVYYPKQNFYYDPYLGTYIVHERGAWVRQVEPPRTFARINVNVLPHVDLFVASYYPFYYNEKHIYTYSVATYVIPDDEYYVYSYPYRYDFSITPYYYYRPAYRGPGLYAYYDPNYYYHPAPPHGHHGHAYGHENHIPPGQWKKGHDVYPGHPGYYAMKQNHHNDHHGPEHLAHNGGAPNTPHNAHSSEFPLNSPPRPQNHHGNAPAKQAPNNHHGQPQKEQSKPFPMNAPQKPGKHEPKPQMENHHNDAPKGKSQSNPQPHVGAPQNHSPKSEGPHQTPGQRQAGPGSHHGNSGGGKPGGKPGKR